MTNIQDNVQYDNATIKRIINYTIPIQQLNCCGDKTVAEGGTVKVCALQLNSCSYWQLFFSVQNGLHRDSMCTSSSA